MMDTFTFDAGSTPLLVSVPHDGRQLPCEIAGEMTGAGRSIPDTDWHVARLYEFARDLGASFIRAEYSRYVVDLNRSADDSELYEGRQGSGLCPTQTFAGEDIYARGTSIDMDERIRSFWHPYHDKVESVLRDIRDTHGYALLWDAHSIPSRVPRLFDGELPELNLGTWDNRSCDAGIADAVMAVATASSFDAVQNGRFKGGHITRHYGRPDDNVHAVQLELAQRSYMDEASLEYDETKASQLRDTLRQMLTVFMSVADK
jgi:N-formylglutamate amidohydrolase